jgi:competence protein ComEA
VDDHGADVDPRAEAALEALRQGRAAPDPGPVDRLDALRRWADVLAQAPRGMGLLAVAGLGVAALVALAWLALRPAGSSEVADGSLFSSSAATVADRAPEVGTTTTADAGIVVHAAGAVRTPGLYRLPSGSRVADLLDKAGGPTAETDLDRLNLAAALADGQRLYVPRKGEVAPPTVGPDGGSDPPPDAGGSPGDGGPVDLNAATAEELDALPGIGPATAAAIIDHRERSGPFTTVDGLLDVRGIGPAKLEALRDLVTAG